MATQLEEERQSVPSVKFKAIGDTFVGMVVDRAEVPLYQYMADGSKGAQIVGKNGKLRTQEMLTLLVMAGTTCTVGDGPAEVGSIGRLYIKGHNRWAYVEAKNAGHGSLCVGDVIRQRYVRDEPGAGGNAKKVSDFALRKPKPEEAQLAAKAEQEHEAMHRKVLDGSPAGGNVPAQYADVDEEAF